MRFLASTTALLSFALTSLHAAEMDVSDLRLSAGLLSNDFKGASSTTVTGGGNVTTNSTSSDEGRDSDHNERAELQYVGGHLGMA
jgi:hypothetical protein